MLRMTDWAIPQQAKLKYTQLFNLHDRSRSGFLSGLQCRDILLQSGLPRNVLAEIWNLSDIDGDGQLTREEFILAMHLTNHVRSGQTLPTELAPDLVPPSYRRTRSISTTSVHSATSTGSGVGSANDDQVSLKSSDNAVPASVLNSHSFEDKRRENYEKGRAELERRRLKIIEQQTSILREQLASSKKQVAEAKAKIDSMRSERDTKMGLITSLEAQLKTIQDRKAYLNHEELNLIAIAKDLNLVSNPAQAEIDQLATQAKQQDIKQMKEKLGEFLLEKEAKSKELAATALRLNESKEQMKTLVETATKTYENYKEKVAKAKELREQFIEENKSKTVNLDSVWDSEPTFVSNLVGSRVEPVNSTPKEEDPWATASVPTNDQFNAFTSISANEDNFFSSSFKNSSSPKSLEGGNVFGDQIPSGQVQQQGVKKYRALYAFEARNLDELTIDPGDLIVGSDEVTEPGWLSGSTNGKSGLFPEAYVELIIEDNPVDSVEPEQVIPAKQESILPKPSELTESIKSTGSATSNGLKYKVVYAFDARNPDELTINPGDIITGSDGAHEPGWLMGELNGQKGLFPESYVETVADEVVAEPEQASGGGKSRSKKAEVATVIANYRALGQEQLNLEKGQLILIRRKMDSGWWEGEIQVKDSELALDKRRSELDHLIEELIDSEQDYLDDLHLCHTSYVLPLSNSFNVDDIFINWATLIKMHETSLKKLQTNRSKNSLDYSLVHETFHSLLSSIVTAYIDFCSRQREAIRLFLAKMASDIRFRQIVDECQRNLIRMLEFSQQEAGEKSISPKQQRRASRNLRLPLDSYLVKPMQRITKYSLLFERIHQVISAHGPKNLEALAKRLKEQAQSLCREVNEACRFKEDNESNETKLQWCQAHLMQEGAIHLQRFNDPTNAASVSEPNQLHSDEIIVFDSKTNCMGQRRYIKSGSLMKQRSGGKELVLFLFNDLLLMTKVKSYGPQLKVEDVFSSARAQHSYYKFYESPMLLEDVVLLSSDSQDGLTSPASPSLTSRSSWGEHQLLAISFSDRSSGKVHSLMALNHQQKLQWIDELSRRPMEAREARARQQAQQLARPIQRPSVNQCYGRLFVTVLELTGDGTSIPLNESCNTGSMKGKGRVSDIHSPVRVCVQMQTRRVRTVLVDLLENKEDTTISSTSDIFKTTAVKVNNIPIMELDKLSSLSGSNCLARFNEECTQFLLERKGSIDGPDILDIGLFDGSKFSESLLIARRKINLDQLIGQTVLSRPAHDSMSSFELTGEEHGASRLQADRPTEFVFKLKSSSSRHPRRRGSVFSASDIRQKSVDTMHLVDRPDLSIKLRFHLQLFST